ncbi:stage II sporulation protein M [Dyella nitratireducens]|uniref:Membrane protein n=1 Tax=Dyella nitratireducens TaxID=1849580 RepID=A0ABQ1FYZ1_9GAMM|nr:stage II sporulation protein M [Dyella nitratireducens]GGA34218.1 membrane protein [Dyella nitratireducens]GLQ40832.1 membrane protein [Dyella nitratireducens]
MKQEQFVALHEKEWNVLRSWLGQLDRTPQAAMRAEHALDFPQAYRRVCHHLALAQARGYSREVTDRLQQIVQMGHRQLYRPPAPRWHKVAVFLVADFPRLVRQQWRCMLVAMLLLYLPAVIAYVAIMWEPSLAHSVFTTRQLADFDHMYDPANSHLGRSSGTDLQMFGFYIMNNVSIAFRTFASGLLFGVGAIYVLAANGVIIGGVAGHLNAIGYGAPFWRFVVGHSGFELTAIVIAGGAGLQFGLSLLAPGRQRREVALRHAAWIGARLAMGAFAMLIAAAFIEAYWSSIAALPDVVKYSSGAGIWVLVFWWLLRGGAGSRHAA